MNTDLLVGGLLLLFGLTSLIVRFVAPSRVVFGRLDLLHEHLGEPMGTTVHIFVYTVVPLLAGAIFVMSGLAPQP